MTATTWPPFPLPTGAEWEERAALVAQYSRWTLKFKPICLIDNHRCSCTWRGGSAEADSWRELFDQIRSRVGQAGNR